jgi:hypothetical protein
VLNWHLGKDTTLCYFGIWLCTAFPPAAETISEGESAVYSQMPKVTQCYISAPTA